MMRAKAGKKSVELQPAARPSRIRREPVRIAESPPPAKLAWWRSEEWEVRLSVGGIIAFALAIFIIALGVSEFTKN